MPKHRKRICFAQPVNSAVNLPEWAKCLLERRMDFALRYNDFASIFPSRDTGILKRSVYKVGRFINRLRALPMIAFSDAVIFCNMDVDDMLFSFASFLRKEIILDFYISEYQTVVQSRKALSADSVKAQKMYRREKKRVERADKVFFHNRTERNLYCGILDADPRSVYYLPIYNEAKGRADLGFYRGEKARPTICWWGSEGNPLHGLSNIVHGLKILADEGFDFEFKIFGWNKEAGDSYYLPILAEVGWEKSVIPEYGMTMADGSLEEYLIRECDLAFGAMSEEPKATEVITNKSVDCISMGIPLVMISCEPIRDIFGQDVYYCEDSAPETIAQRVKDALSDSDAFERTERARRVYETEFSAKLLNKRFIAAISDEV